MLSKHDSIQQDQLEVITLNQLVPVNHLARKLDAAIDISFIYDLVKDMYSEVGRPFLSVSRASTPFSSNCFSHLTNG
ncbi:hypothetical protein AAEY33_02675 [Peribacillus simplex]|jgi:hypothetical protein|nr:hypothetical protein [Peribacillus simplex]